MEGAPHAGGNLCGSQKTAVKLAQRRVIRLRPRARAKSVSARRQAQPMRAAYHAILADTHTLANFGCCESRVPIGGELRVALWRPG
jgi:hypothetical protein